MNINLVYVQWFALWVIGVRPLDCKLNVKTLFLILKVIAPSRDQLNFTEKDQDVKTVIEDRIAQIPTHPGILVVHLRLLRRQRG